MSRFVAIAAAAFITAAPAFAAPKSALPFPVAADGTTNIASCANVSADFRNECISRSRPLTGKQVYAQAAADKAVAAKKAAREAAVAQKAAKAKAAAERAAAKAARKVPAAVANVPKGFKVAKDGTTNIADCLKAAPTVRNECISRARPMTGKELAKFTKVRSAVAAEEAKKAAAKPAVKQAAAPAPVKAVAAAPVVGKGFKIAKDGTTNIADCAKANPDFRNECISRSRPVPGKLIYTSEKKS